MGTIQHKEFFDTAQQIVFQLLREAHWYDGMCCWSGHELTVVDGAYQVVNRSFGGDVYNGTAGIIAFLGKYFAYDADPIVWKTINGGVKHLQFLLEQEAVIEGISYFSGKLGMAHQMYLLGENCDQADWKSYALSVFDSMVDYIPQPMELDVISGAAGIIPVWLDMFVREGKDSYREAAIACGDFLIDQANKFESHWTWHSIPGSTKGLTGYSHGASGFGLALLELYYQTGLVRFWEACRMAFMYEKISYDPSQNNWPDFRDNVGASTQQVTCMHAWCHGAPGIALARIRAYEITQIEDFKQEAQLALQSTAQHLQHQLSHGGNNYSLCHGLGGNALALESGNHLFSGLRNITEAVANQGIQQYGKWHLDWPSGVNDPSGKTQGQQSTPGLMLGLAGTGWFYLQMAVTASLEHPLLIRPKKIAVLEEAL